MQLVLFLVLGTSLLMAQKIELLWPEAAPGALGSEDRDKPLDNHSPGGSRKGEWDRGDRVSGWWIREPGDGS